MKALGLAGSPRRCGNSEILLDKFLEGTIHKGGKTEKIVISELKIAPCNATNACFKTGVCDIKDDMQQIYEKLLEADCVVLASPIYFYSVTAQAKALIDRSQCLWAKQNILGQDLTQGKERLGVFISVAGTGGEKVFDGSILTVRYFFKAIGVKYFESLLFRNIDKKKDILKHSNALSQSFSLGEKVVEIIKSS
ncbi:MAG: flavodoxin family protein [Actinobacteria bacterium]|nr:flavodoxin family protein [Actinomycetota bacterium]